MKELWYKNAIIYSLDVETFMDSDGNGVGDFQGLTNRLDHLSGLGILDDRRKTILDRKTGKNNFIQKLC